VAQQERSMFELLSSEDEELRLDSSQPIGPYLLTTTPKKQLKKITTKHEGEVYQCPEEECWTDSNCFEDVAAQSAADRAGHPTDSLEDEPSSLTSSSLEEEEEEELDGLMHTNPHPRGQKARFQEQQQQQTQTPTCDDPNKVYCSLCNCSWTRRQIGIMAAIFNGLWGGSILAPMKFNTSDIQGISYLISFAVGAATVNVSLWILRYINNLLWSKGSFSKAYRALPSFHVQVMWRAGGTSGLLWSIGNVCSLLAVYNLGEGVGYSACQASILVSGLWGIIYFKEVTGMLTITKWMCSASITVTGILLLSYEHHET